MHIAQIGTGRVGRPTAYTLLCAELADTLTVCDTKPRLAAAFAEELKHVAASLGLDVEIVACEKDECVAGADVILISAGEPRIAGVQMSRRDLALQNGKIVKYVAEVTSPRNPSAKYIVITNPVDAMAMVCKKYSKADFVVSTGTNLESLRFRSRIAETLGVPVSKVSGWVGGEHGDAAVPLWSTVKVDGKPIGDYAKDEGKPFNKTEVDSYVKLVSKQIVDNIGGTEYGPAASFRDILRAIVNDTGETLSISTPVNLEGISEPVFVGMPLRLGKSVGPTLYKELSIEERKALIEAGKAIYQTYLTSISGMT